MEAGNRGSLRKDPEVQQLLSELYAGKPLEMHVQHSEALEEAKELVPRRFVSSARIFSRRSDRLKEWRLRVEGEDPPRFWLAGFAVGS